MKYIKKFESFEPGPAPEIDIKTSQITGKINYLGAEQLPDKQSLTNEGIYSQKLREILNELKSKGDEVAYFLLWVEDELQNDGYELIDIDTDSVRPYYLEIEIDGKKTWKKIDEWTNQIYSEKRDGKFHSIEMDKFMKNYVSLIKEL
jgi:hypothetical protein